MLERRAADEIPVCDGLKGAGPIKDGCDRSPGRVDQTSDLSDVLGGRNEYER